MRPRLKLWLGIWLLCVLLGLGFGAYEAITLPDIYRAMSRFCINLRSYCRDPLTDYEEISVWLENQPQYMTNGPVLERVFARLHQDRSTSQPAQIVSYTAKLDKGTCFIMTAESTDLYYAKRFAAVWPEEFARFKNEVWIKAMLRSSEGLIQEVQI
jgi:hypothetical protein